MIGQHEASAGANETAEENSRHMDMTSTPRSWAEAHRDKKPPTSSADKSSLILELLVSLRLMGVVVSEVCMVCAVLVLLVELTSLLLISLAVLTRARVFMMLVVLMWSLNAALILSSVADCA